MHARNVLRVNAVEEQAAYREAVSQILLDVQNDHKVTLHEISEAIDVSLGTVSNASNKKTDLNSIYLNRIGKVYGAYHLTPYAKLSGGRVVMDDPAGCDDVLPILTLATHRIAQSRSPSSPGGVTETLREQLGYLPDLRRLHREMEALICRIEKRKAAA